jgi:hypothetical protein
MKRMKIVPLAVCAGALVLAAVSGASAQEEGVAMKSILGAIGIIPKDPPNINYRERAPLVLPPKMELRAPGDPAALEAKTANWPKDPDVIAARKEAEEARTPWTQSEAYKLTEGKRLSVEEIRAGRRPGNYVTVPDPAANDRRADNSKLTPDQLRSFASSTPKLESGGLERHYLSDPPEGLLKAANGGQLKVMPEKPQVGDPESPYAFIRQQRGEN